VWNIVLLVLCCCVVCDVLFLLNVRIVISAVCIITYVCHCKFLAFLLNSVTDFVLATVVYAVVYICFLAAVLSQIHKKWYLNRITNNC